MTTRTARNKLNAPGTGCRRGNTRRRGAAFMLALFVMSVATLLVISILDTQTMQYAALRNTVDYDHSRYLAEAGVQHCLAYLEQDFDWRDGIPRTEFPTGSGNTYWATVVDGTNGTVVITGWGEAGSFVRHLEVTVKMGG